MNGMEAFLSVAVIGLFFALGVGLVEGGNDRVAAIRHACGECDHVGECGDYQCRPGVDGWQLKAGAR